MVVRKASVLVVISAKPNQKKYMVARGKNGKSLLVQSTVKEHAFSFIADKLFFRKTKRPLPPDKNKKATPKLDGTRIWAHLSPLGREVLERNMSSCEEFHGVGVGGI